MKNSLGIVQLYNEPQYGRTKCTSKNIDQHFMIVYEITANDFYDDSYKNILDYSIKNIGYCLINNKSINNVRNQQLDIVEIIELPTLEQVGIIKTIWLKLFQLKFKKYLSNK
tara:strand:+ start:280 stop:615 length:336 start_codon:yes stop_codon:yes gene_type:complete